MKLTRILGVVLAIGIVLTSTITVEAKPGKRYTHRFSILILKDSSE